MLYANNDRVKSLLLHGFFGLEKESMRVLSDGHLAQTPDPFLGNPNIVRDFSEAQVEINTGVHNSAKAVVEELDYYNATIQKTLSMQKEREFLWPSSNPPCLGSEQDIPIAQYYGDLAHKTAYREHLAWRYGRRLMTFSGIHFNYSFSPELLEASFDCSPLCNFEEYKNQVYVHLAERAEAYGWILTAITAASPVMDMSYVETSACYQDIFMGFATVRGSELGYWNTFAPILNYDSVKHYASSIQSYVDNQLISSPSELYFPIRLKPPGTNTLSNLEEHGVDHIELRMFDVNPLFRAGVNVQDVLFAQLLLVWLACLPSKHLNVRDQVQAIQNLKNAARYDLKTAKIVLPSGTDNTVEQSALFMIENMLDFYKEFGQDVIDCIRYQKQKFVNPNKRYAWQLRSQKKKCFISDMLERSRTQQESYL